MKNGLPRIATAPTAVRTSRIGDNTVRARKDNRKSKNLLKYLAYIYTVSLLSYINKTTAVEGSA